MMTPTGGGEEVLKPNAQWTNAEFELSKWNQKAWHALICAVDENQYKLIQNTKIAKEAWDILEVAHEGTESSEGLQTSSPPNSIRDTQDGGE